MEKTFDIRIESMKIDFNKITQRDGILIFSSIFGAYRAAGRSEKDAYVAALNDLMWLLPHLEEVMEQLFSDKK